MLQPSPVYDFECILKTKNRTLKINPLSTVSREFTHGALRNAYATPIRPVGVYLIERLKTDLLPPLTQRGIGAPKKRIKSQGEGGRQCTRCQGFGHYSTTCKEPLSEANHPKPAAKKAAAKQSAAKKASPKKSKKPALKARKKIKVESESETETESEN